MLLKKTSRGVEFIDEIVAHIVELVAPLELFLIDGERRHRKSNYLDCRLDFSKTAAVNEGQVLRCLIISSLSLGNNVAIND